MTRSAHDHHNGAHISDANILASVHNLSVHFNTGKGRMVKAVDDVSLSVQAGSSLGIVGESGSGKSTLIRAMLGLQAPTNGDVELFGRSLASLSTSELRRMRADMQLIFQDPLASLNPRMTVGDIIAEPLKVHKPQYGRKLRRQAVQVMLDKVGLKQSHINRYPHEFSGGQAQRIGIARALIVEPKLLFCDEPVSALDVSIQAQILNLLMKLRQDMGLTIVFISHDLSVVRHLCDDIVVMKQGQIVERGSRQQVFNNPQEVYTQQLLSAIPHL